MQCIVETLLWPSRLTWQFSPCSSSSAADRVGRGGRGADPKRSVESTHKVPNYAKRSALKRHTRARTESATRNSYLTKLRNTHETQTNAPGISRIRPRSGPPPPPNVSNGFTRSAKPPIRVPTPSDSAQTNPKRSRQLRNQGFMAPQEAPPRVACGVDTRNNRPGAGPRTPFNSFTGKVFISTPRTPLTGPAYVHTDANSTPLSRAPGLHTERIRSTSS